MCQENNAFSDYLSWGIIVFLDINAPVSFCLSPHLPCTPLWECLCHPNSSSEWHYSHAKHSSLSNYLVQTLQNITATSKTLEFIGCIVNMCGSCLGSSNLYAFPSRWTQIWTNIGARKYMGSKLSLCRRRSQRDNASKKGWVGSSSCEVRTGKAWINGQGGSRD